MAENTAKIDAKVYKYRPSSVSGIQLRDNHAAIVGNRDHHIVSDSIFGNFISGKTSILADVAQIRISGMWTLNPELLSTIPSTMTTPNATLRLDIPTKNVSVLASVVNLFKEFLA